MSRIFKPDSGQPLIFQTGSAIKLAEGKALNSLGYLDRIFFGCSYYLSTAKSGVVSTQYTHVDTTWTLTTVGTASGTTTGSTNADPMGKFSGGIWTPTIAGYYLCTYSAMIGGIGDGNQVITFLGKNWTELGVSAGNAVGICRQYGSAASQVQGTSGSGILGLSTGDFVKLIVYQNSGSNQEVYDGGNTTIGFYYLGKNVI